jgi:hypothetical protein
MESKQPTRGTHIMKLIAILAFAAAFSYMAADAASNVPRSIGAYNARLSTI